VAAGQHRVGGRMLPEQQEHALQDTGLPADPFGQGARLSSEDGSAGSRPLFDPISGMSSSSTGSHLSSADPEAVGGTHPAKKAGTMPAEGAAGGSEASTSNGAVSVAGVGSVGAVAGSGADARVQSVLGSLSGVLGPSVLDAWDRLHVQPVRGRHTGQDWSR
jgi:hypothetical protein